MNKSPAILAAGLSLALILAGCQSGTTTKPTAGEQTKPSTAVSQSAPATSAPAAKKEESNTKQELFTKSVLPEKPAEGTLSFFLEKLGVKNLPGLSLMLGGHDKFTEPMEKAWSAMTKLQASFEESSSGEQGESVFIPLGAELNPVQSRFVAPTLFVLEAHQNSGGFIEDQFVLRAIAANKEGESSLSSVLTKADGTIQLQNWKELKGTPIYLHIPGFGAWATEYKLDWKQKDFSDSFVSLLEKSMEVQGEFKDSSIQSIRNLLRDLASVAKADWDSYKPMPTPAETPAATQQVAPAVTPKPAVQPILPVKKDSEDCGCGCGCEDGSCGCCGGN